MTTLLRSPLVASIVLLGCTPLPESAGETLSTSDGSEPGGSETGEATVSDDGSDDGSDELEPEPKLELLLAPAVTCTDLAPMPDGGVAVLLDDSTAHDLADGQVLRRYAADGSMLWQRPDGAETHAMIALPDGRLVVGGGVSQAPRQAAAWVLSPDGAVLATYTHPLDGSGQDALVTRVAASEGAIAFVVTTLEDDGSGGLAFGSDSVAYAGLDLVPQWWWEPGDPAPHVRDLQLAASGSVRTLALDDEADAARLRTLSTSGVLEDDELVNASMSFLRGEPGALVGYGPAGVLLLGLDERPELGDLAIDHDLAGLPSGWHQGGLWIGGAEPGGTAATILRLDVDGSSSYQRALAPIAGPQVAVRAIAPGPDDSVYLCGSEFAEDGSVTTQAFLSRRYPLW